MNIKMMGKIKWYKPSKGYGYIIGYDEEVYYFEISNCLDKELSFVCDEKVEFIPMFESEISYALEVKKISN